MKNTDLGCLFGLWLFLASPAWSHHSFAAQYDEDQPVTLSGVVTRVEFTNPHARFYIDVVDESGNIVNWNLELASPNVLRRRGWSRDFVKPGDEVTVEGSLARDGSKMANALSVSLADGTLIMSRE